MIPHTFYPFIQLQKKIVPSALFLSLIRQKCSLGYREPATCKVCLKTKNTHVNLINLAVRTTFRAAVNIELINTSHVTSKDYSLINHTSLMSKLCIITKP